MGAYYLNKEELSEVIVEAIMQAGGDFTDKTLDEALKLAKKKIKEASKA